MARRGGLGCCLKSRRAVSCLDWFGSDGGTVAIYPTTMAMALAVRAPAPSNRPALHTDGGLATKQEACERLTSSAATLVLPTALESHVQKAPFSIWTRGCWVSGGGLAREGRFKKM